MLSPELLEAFRRGDPDAFMTVYDTHAAALRPLVAGFFRSPFEREEAAQEVWLLVHRMASAYDPGKGALLPWLRTVATNRCREILRARGRRPGSDAQVDEDAPASDSPELDARHHRLRQALERFAATLTEEEAAVFRLSLMEELGHDEVAARTGIPARRCKYLKLKLIERAARSPLLRQALDEVVDR